MSAKRANREERPVARIEALERSARKRSGVLQCVIGRDLVVDPEVLSNYCFRALSSRIDDLVLIAGVVAFADRSIARRPSVCWGRNLTVVIPVLEPVFWRRPNMLQTLSSTIGLVTGDRWQFEFKKRQTGTRVSAQAPLSLTYGSPPIVMPYSDGLDSLAVARLISAEEPSAGLFLVTTGQRGDADKAWREKHLVGRRHRVSVPFQISDKKAAHKFREPSYRSRGFVYGIISCIAAYLSGGSRIVVSESGQGLLGPWLAPVGNEALDVRTHPIFTRQLSVLTKVVLETRVAFEHPRIWFTKGQTLGKLAELGIADGWSRTRSCARDARHMNLDGALVQCGVCASCLLRRQSVHAANLRESQEGYFWRNLHAVNLAGAAPPRSRTTSSNDERQAICGVLSLDQLADLADNVELINRSAEELHPALGGDVSDIRSNLRRLLGSHQREWHAFIGAQGRHSFLNSWMEAR